MIPTDPVNARASVPATIAATGVMATSPGTTTGVVMTVSTTVTAIVRLVVSVTRPVVVTRLVLTAIRLLASAMKVPLFRPSKRQL